MEDQEELSQEAINSADCLIKDISQHFKHDYSSKRLVIADHYENQLMCGNWDSTLDFDDMLSLRFMQEDEYDQHMGDDPPEYDLFSGDHYIIIGDGQ